MRILNCKEAGGLSISQQNDWQEQYNFPKEDHNEIFFLVLQITTPHLEQCVKLDKS